jgi:drug/metabolite transporter (DMT)-like permease
MPSVASLPAVGASLALGAVYLLPVLGITLWSAQRLPPALLSFLFTLEIVSGVISGAIFLNEPFGPARMAGGILIASAALIEAFAALRAAPKPAV